MTLTLENIGFTVLVSLTSSDALTYSIVDNELIYVVLCDLNLGWNGMDGLTVCRRIKKHDPLVFTIAMTGKPDFDISSARDSGVDEYLPKPFHLDELEKRITYGYERSEVWRGYR